MDPRAASVYADLDDVLGTGSRAEFTRWVERAIDWFDRNRAILPAWDEALVLEPDFREPAREAIAALPDAMPSYLARWGSAGARGAGPDRTPRHATRTVLHPLGRAGHDRDPPRPGRGGPHRHLVPALTPPAS